MAEVGDRAPDFTARDHLGNKVTMSDFQGRKKVMLVFYVLAWTPI